MKLLQILYPGLGGHSSVAFSLIEGDKEREFTHSLLGYGIEEPSAMFVRKAKELKVNSQSILKKRGFDFQSQKAVYKILKKEKPDYIILHSTSLIFVVFWYGLFHKVKWLSVEHQSNHAKTRIDWIYCFFILLLAPRIVYLTAEYKQEIKEKFKFFVSNKKINIIPNGINTEKFKPAKEKEKTDEVVFSMISRMTKLRDHRTLILAIKEIAKTTKCKLYIAGDGETFDEYNALVKELELENTVVFTGTLNEEELIKLLHKTDIYIHSSLAETQSTSLLQVMACKVPIIATDIKGINNLLVDSEDALLFEAKNKIELISKIAELLRRKELQNKLTESAYFKLIETYDSSKLIKKYLNAIKE
ncbi:MAG TPA: glycosyltransferase family 4 protein [Petrimonas sp.]|nr:glycosyltransferase family 4 protein [Petrimonas sp.]